MIYHCIKVKKINMAVKIYHEDGTVEELVPKSQGGQEKPAQNPVVETQHVVSPEKIDPSATDQEKYDQIVVKMGETYRHKQRICNHLVDVFETAGLERRQAIVNEIKELRTQYNELFYQKDHFERHGVFPIRNDGKIKLTELQKDELVQKRLNIRSNISKAKSMVVKYQHKPEKLVQYQSKQVQLQAELDEIDGLLGR
jgi:hypothetical protein